MAYLDNSGLYIKYGTERAAVDKGGEYVTDGAMREIELKIDLTDLTASETILSDNIVMPKSCIITEIEVRTHTAAATGTAIDLGLVKASDRTTEIDYDGLLAAFPTASMSAAGEIASITDNTTYDGALIGAVLEFPAHFTCSRTDATAFTAGIIYVTVRYYRP